MTPFETTLHELVTNEVPVTVAGLGVIAEIPVSAAVFPLFPIAVAAFVREWSDLDADARAAVAALISEAVRSGSAASVAEICSEVVPDAEAFGLVQPLKAALRDRVGTRNDASAAAAASIALRWLTHLAVLAQSPRHALHDTLEAVTEHESVEFSVAAAQCATVAHDFWGDDSSRNCLDLLTRSSASDDAWFGLGQASIRDALEKSDRDQVIDGLRAALVPFEQAGSAGEERADAAVYVDIIRFVTGWSVQTTPTDLQEIRTSAAGHLNEYMLGGLGLADQPVWLRSRFAVESSWLDLLDRMDATIDAGDDASWLTAAGVLDSLADLYRAAASFVVTRTDPTGDTPSVVDLVAPQIADPFIKDTRRLAIVARWADESDHPDASTLRDLVDQRAQEAPTPGKHWPSGRSRR